MSTSIDTDYLVIGSGAVGLAFVDTILAETDADVTIVDRHGKPGGHWNDAYSFVQLHQPSAFYGVNSVALGSGARDIAGTNEGYYELATGSEVCAYFDKVMHQHFLPTGRVRYFPMSDYQGDGEFVSLLSGTRTRVNVARKTVDATFYRTSVPSTHTRKFAVTGDAVCIPPNALAHLWQDPSQRRDRFVILGAGKTAMDVGVWLLRSGADPASISWIVPRDSWLLNRHHTQPGDDFFHQTIGGQADQLEALAHGRDIEDVFARLEASGVMIRIDPDVRPTMYHCATLSLGEVELLRQIRHVIRMGRVRQVTERRISLDQGEINFDASVLYIDCTAQAVPPHDPVPVFQGDLITLQMVRTCQPTFSSALIAHVEAHKHGEAEKNALTSPVPLPDGLDAFLPVTFRNMMNQFQWSQDKALRAWITESRLDGFSKVMRSVSPDQTDRLAVLERFKTCVGPAIANMQKLMAEPTT